MIDTANAYANGMSEKVIGAWIKDNHNRKNIYIVDKGCHPKDEEPDIRRVTPDAIKEDIEESLRRLDTDYIDLFLLHRDDEGQSVSDIIDTLNSELASGRIRSFGASNWTQSRIETANSYAKERGLTGFCTSSCGFNLAVPNEPMWPGAVQLSAKDIAWYEEHRFPLIAWSSQAAGWFSEGGLTDPEVKRVYDSDINKGRGERAARLAKERGVTTIQIALAYTYNKSKMILPIVGPQSVEELIQNVEACKIGLTAEQINYLENAG